MFHLMFPFGLGFAGFGVLAAAAALVYPVLVIWMIVDGVLRADAEYPGADPNRKVLWVLGMVLLHPVAIAYFIAVYLKVRRTRRAAPVQYTASMAPPVPGAPAAG